MTLPNRRVVLGFAGVAGFASLLLVLALGYPSSPRTQASNQSESTAMSIVVNGISGGISVECDSVSVGECVLDPNSGFTVSLVPRVIPPGGYSFWQTLLNYGSLDYVPRALAAEISWDESFAPLRSPDPPLGDEGIINHGDLSQFFPPLPRSQQKSVLVTLDFNCTGPDTGDTLEMTDFDVVRDGSVFGGDGGTDIFVPEVDSLDIDCEAAPPPPTATPTDTPVPPTPEKPCGDVNDDGNVTSTDALLILQFVVGLLNSVSNADSADVNSDGEVSSLDALLVLQSVAGLLDVLDCP